MQTKNPFLDDMARVASGAFGAASGMRTEAEAAIRERLRRFAGDMDWVTREEFEAVKEMAAKARTEQEALAKRVAALEAELSGRKAGASKPKSRTTRKSS